MDCEVVLLFSFACFNVVYSHISCLYVVCEIVRQILTVHVDTCRYGTGHGNRNVHTMYSTASLPMWTCDNMWRFLQGGKGNTQEKRIYLKLFRKTRVPYTIYPYIYPLYILNTQEKGDFGSAAFFWSCCRRRCCCRWWSHALIQPPSLRERIVWQFLFEHDSMRYPL